MSRHQLRLLAVQILYEWDFYHRDSEQFEKIVSRQIAAYALEGDARQFLQALLSGVRDHFSSIDKILQEAAPQWSIERMSLVDRNILRLGLYELLYYNVPPRVAINEAIELGKDFSGETARRFINGVLGTVYEEVKKVKKEKK